MIYFAVLLLLLTQLSQQHSTNECFSKNFQIIEDENLFKILKEIQINFLKTRENSKFNRLDFTVLLPTHDPKIWRRASVGGNNPEYPASTVKVPFMLAAMWWCAQHQKPVDCLDNHGNQTKHSKHESETNGG
jgi:hypothetical protein